MGKWEVKLESDLKSTESLNKPYAKDVLLGYGFKWKTKVRVKFGFPLITS